MNIFIFAAIGLGIFYVISLLVYFLYYKKQINNFLKEQTDKSVFPFSDFIQVFSLAFFIIEILLIFQGVLYHEIIAGQIRILLFNS